MIIILILTCNKYLKKYKIIVLKKYYILYGTFLIYYNYNYGKFRKFWTKNGKIRR